MGHTGFLAVTRGKFFNLKQTISLETTTDADYEDGLVLLVNITVQAESLLYSVKQVAEVTGLYVSVNKIEVMYFKQEGASSTLSSQPLKLVDQFTYLGSNISSTESNTSIRIVKACNAVGKLSIICQNF